MGQKVNPIGFRTGIFVAHQSSWYANEADYVNFLKQDYQIRKFLQKKLKVALVEKINVKIEQEILIVTINAVRPGIIIGSKGQDIESLRKQIHAIVDKYPASCIKRVEIDIIEVKNPATSATLVAQNIAYQLEKRLSFRRAMKRAIQLAMTGVRGIKISVSGRLGGVDIARTETAREGSIPLHTLRANIDYAATEAHTTYGIIGVKVWLYKGDLYNSVNN